ncbi:MAG: hypothetical protein Fur0041_22170 [Bacteroidia bacterium]
MISFRYQALPVLAATIWVSISEFARNEFILKSHWTSHYEQMGQVFPALPVNGAVWGIWSLVYSICIYVFAGKFNLIQTALLSWVIGFVMMWLVIGNLGVLPLSILPVAVPMSMLEAFLASFIIHKLKRK